LTSLCFEWNDRQDIMYNLPQRLVKLTIKDNLSNHYRTLIPKLKASNVTDLELNVYWTYNFSNGDHVQKEELFFEALRYSKVQILRLMINDNGQSKKFDWVHKLMVKTLVVGHFHGPTSVTKLVAACCLNPLIKRLKVYHSDHLMTEEFRLQTVQLARDKNLMLEIAFTIYETDI
jgi:hypothetical protein